MKVTILSQRNKIGALLTSSLAGKVWQEGRHLPYWEPHALAARLEADTGRRFLAVLIEGSGGVALTVLWERDGNVLGTLVPREPFLASTDFYASSGAAETIRERVMREVLRASGAAGVYLQETEAQSTLARLFGSSGALVWRRPPNPVIDWADNGEALLRRTEEHLGKNFRKRMRRWERELRVTQLHGRRALDAVDYIERRSWKARERTSLDAGERAFYSSLLSRLPDCRLVLCTTCDTEPVAYFLEMRGGDTAYGMESSYVHDYARLSPGTFLTTADLYRRWHGTTITTYDLLGGRGPLKDAIASYGIARIDIAWPDCSATRQLRAERQRYDRHWAEVSRRGLGVRHLVTAYKQQAG